MQFLKTEPKETKTRILVTEGIVFGSITALPFQTIVK